MASPPDNYMACACGLRGSGTPRATHFQGFSSYDVQSEASTHTTNQWWDNEKLRFNAVCVDTGKVWR